VAQRVIAGRYELDRLLGRGGMGEVWVARDCVMDRAVAVKLLQDHLGTVEGEELFFREARTAGALSHPGIVTVHDLGRDGDGTLYLVMEHVPGRDLAVVLRDGPPLVADVLAWTAQVADALHAAHIARILHRDLKPANLMLTPAGSVKILDFGIARYASTRTTTSRPIGTIAYMPPERLLGKVGDARGDLYSLGCVLYELLTGHTPFGHLNAPALMYAHVHTPSAPPTSHRPDLPPHLDALLAELLAKNPDHRPASAAAVRDRLSRLVAPSLSGAPPTSLTAPDHRETAPTVASGFRPPPGRRTTPTPFHRPWKYTTESTVQSSPVVVDGLVYVGSNDHRLYALDAATGTPRWIHRTGAAVRSSPAVVDGTVYVGSWDGKVSALDAATGALRWTHTTDAPVQSSPAIADGLVYVGTNYGSMYALDAATGTPRWTHTTDGPVQSSPAIADGLVYVGSDDRKVYALDAATGTARWMYTGDSATQSSLAIADGLVYVGSWDRKVYALDAATGAPRWTHAPEGPYWGGSTGSMVHVSSSVVGGLVYVGSCDGTVYALDAATGQASVS